MGWNLLGNALYEPLSLRNAATNNLVAWTCDGALAPASPGISAGYLYVCRAFIDQSIVANNAYISQLTPGVGCANSFIGVYNATTNTLIAQTGDISSALNASQTTPIEAALTYALAAQAFNQQVWLVLLIGSQTSSPSLVGCSNYGSNIGQTSGYRFQMSTANGYTALPTTMPAIGPAGATQSMPFLAIGP